MPMPYYGTNDYKEQCARVRARYAKLIAKGLDPRSNKFRSLMFRR